MRRSGMVGSGDKRLQAPAAALPSGGESEGCPRCGSHNTKFCYYNNYNLAQPRHFCKACRRYWTLGGTLRNVPIGGSTRRATQNKQHASGSVSTASSSTRRRPAPAPASASASASVSVSSSSSTSSSPPVTSLAFDAASVPHLQPTCKAEPLTAAESGSMDAVRSFESLLTEPLPAGFLALGEPFLGGREGFGLGLGLSDGPAEIIDEIGFGIERAAPAWPFFSDDEGPVAAGDSNTATGGIVGIDREREAWQVVANGAGMVGDDGGDCFGWPELAMWTTPGKGLQ